MAVYNVHGGHSLKCRGAAGYLDEVNEDRKVKNKVIELLKKEGHTVYDCTDDAGTTQNANLSAIVKKCNAHTVDLDISIHLNAGGGTGTEVYHYDDGEGKEIAKNVSAKVAVALGLKDRGAKSGKHLYVLKNTKATAVLVECCFVDSETDKNAWNVDKCAKAIVEGILNKNVPDKEDATDAPAQSKPQPTPPKTDNIDVEYAVMIEGGMVLPAVKNLSDFAGIRGKKIVGLAMKVSKGSIKYRVTTVGGKTYPWVTGYNWKDAVNGWAGDGKNAIAKVECYLYSPNSDKYIFYRVSPVNKDYYAYQRDTDKGSGMDGFAGAPGVAIDRFQAYIK